MRIKSIHFAAIATFVLSAAVSCTQEVYPEASGVEMTFTAIHAEDGEDTRTVLGKNGAVLWSPADEVSIFKGSGSGGGSKFVSQNSSPAKTVDFKGYLEGLGGLSSGQYYWAIYPYSTNNSCDGQSITATLPANQIAVKGSFGKGCHPAIARTTGTGLAFYAVAGGLEFTVTRSDITAITIKGNNNEALAGIYKASFGSDGMPTVQVSNGQKEITLTAPDGTAFESGESYIISLLPTSLSKGITITLTTSDNKTGTITSDKQQTVKRSVLGVLKDIDTKAEWSSGYAIPEAVDLGLPSGLKWAAFNLGATKPEEYGEYFAWGETVPKDNYSWETYKFELGTNSNGPFSKYVTKSSYGTVDNKTVLDPEDDAAHVNWGGSWRMPADAEWTELGTQCTWTRTTQNGVNGRLVTGPNGKSIFLPAAGIRDGTDLGDTGSWGYYWSSSLDTDNPGGAWAVYFYAVFVDRDHYYRYTGLSVRPVTE